MRQQIQLLNWILLQLCKVTLAFKISTILYALESYATYVLCNSFSCLFIYCRLYIVCLFIYHQISLHYDNYIMNFHLNLYSLCCSIWFICLSLSLSPFWNLFICAFLHLRISAFARFCICAFLHLRISTFAHWSHPSLHPFLQEVERWTRVNYTWHFLRHRNTLPRWYFEEILILGGFKPQWFKLVFFSGIFNAKPSKYWNKFQRGIEPTEPAHGLCDFITEPLGQSKLIVGIFFLWIIIFSNYSLKWNRTRNR